MMPIGTSSTKDLIELDSSTTIEKTAFSTMTARILRNNVHHLADELAQVRIAYQEPLDSSTIGFSRYETEADGEDVWLQVARFAFYPHIYADGTPYHFRFRIAGSVSASTSVHTLRVIVGPRDVIDPQATDNPQVDSYDIDSSSIGTSHAWLTGPTSAILTPGVNKGEPILWSPSDETVEVYPYEAAIFWSRDASGTDRTFRLSGFYLAEFIGER